MLEMKRRDSVDSVRSRLGNGKRCFHQKYSFNASWISREVRWNVKGAPAALIVPAPALPMLAAGLLNCGVLLILKDSPRNCRRRPPSADRLKSLNRDKSACAVPGPSRILRPVFPNCCGPGAVNAAMLNHRA